MVASWETFRGNFVGLNEKTKILEKESVVRLGQRVYDLAAYVSKQLTPNWDEEYATLVHGDYKAMNEVFRGRFGPNPPVRTTVATYGGVPGNSLVEMDCIAYIKKP